MNANESYVGRFVFLLVDQKMNGVFMRPAISEDVTELFLVRHGATEANERKPYVLQGQGIDLSLSETGRSQAEKVARFLSGFSVSAVYCSGMVRARETAGLIASPHDLTAQTVSNIHEVDVGKWEGKSWDQVMSENETAYNTFMANPGETPYLNGESYRDVLNRTKPALEPLFEKHRGQTIVVVAHNVVNRAYLADVMGLELRLAKGIPQANCCVNIIHQKENQAELVTLNAHFHLFEA